jgi:hypothetical protein
LTLGSACRQDISGMLWPPLLHTLYLGPNVRHSHAVFPDSIHTLKLGDCKVTDTWSLPKKLKTLILGDGLNGLNEHKSFILGNLNNGHYISESLEHLDFGKRYDEIIDDMEWVGYNNLYSIILAENFNKGISRVKWPMYLRTLQFGEWFNQDMTGVMFPETLISITMGQQFNQTINYVKFPTKLEVLILCPSRFDQKIDIVLLNLTDIILGHQFNKTIQNINLPKLENLTLGNKFNQSLNGTCLSNTIYKIKFGSEFNQPIISVKWPTSLGIIIFGRNFNQSIDVEWPIYLHTITFGENFNKCIKNVKFQNLGTIHDYSNSITITSCSFPPSLHKIIHYTDGEWNDPVCVIYEKYIGSHTKMAFNI